MSWWYWVLILLVVVVIVVIVIVVLNKGGCNKNGNTTDTTTKADNNGGCGNNQVRTVRATTGGCGGCGGGTDTGGGGTTTTIPAAVTNLMTGTITTTTVPLTWTAGARATSYDVSYKLNTATTWSSFNNTTNTSITVTGLTQGTAYDFMVVSKNTAGSSTGTTIFNIQTTVLLGQPTGLAAGAITTTSIEVNWASTQNSTGYILNYKVSTDSSWTTAFNNLTTNTAIVTGLTPNTTYSFQVIAKGSSGNSEPSVLNNITTMIMLQAPTNILAQQVGTSSVTLTWSPVSSAISYDVYYQKQGASTWSSYGNVSGTTATVINLDGDTIYNFKVVATNSTGSSDPGFLNAIRTTISAPTNLNPTVITATFISISWNSVPNVTNYGVSYKASSASDWIFLGNVTNTSATFNNLTSDTFYSFQVVSNNSSGGTSTPAVLNSVRTKLAAPTNITATVVSPTSSSLTWTASTGAATYSVSYQASGSTTWNAYGNVSSTSVTINGLTDGVVYNYRVVATNTYGSSEPGYSNITSVVLNPVTNLSSNSITGTSVSLTWDNVSGASSYNVSFQSSGSNVWTAYQTTTLNSITVENLTAGTTYNFKVTSADSYGESSPAILNSIKTVSVPGPVTNAVVSGVTTTSLQVTWTAGTNATDYSVKSRIATTGVWSAAYFTSLTTATITGLTSGSSYDIEIISRNVAGLSTPVVISNTSTGSPPATPTNLVAGTLTTTTIPLTWTASSGTGITYTVSYKLKSASQWTQFGSPVTTTSVTVTGVTPGATYTIQVVASNVYGASSPALLDDVLIPSIPGPPTNLSAGTITHNSVVLNWSPGTNATNYLISYKLSNTVQWFSSTPTNNLTTTITNLSPNTVYVFQVISVNGSGSSTPAELTGIRTLVEPPIILPAPTNLRIVTKVLSDSLYNVRVAWDAVSGAVGYKYSLFSGVDTIDYPQSTGTYFDLVISQGVTSIFYVSAVSSNAVSTNTAFLTLEQQA